MNWWENDLPSGASSGTDRVSQFTATYRPLAEKIGQELGVSPDILLAKFGSETGWGKSVIPGTNNLGNIKDPSGRGVFATDNMTKSRDAYRVFETPESFGDYYTAFIKRAYPKAVGAGSDPMAFAQGLKEGVRGSYAEDPEYGPKIARATNMVTKGNTASDAGAWWSNDLPAAAAPASSGEQWWANDLPAAPATTQAAPKASPQPAPAPAPTAPQRSAASSFGLGTRNVLEGVEQAFTYPVRAVGEAASGIAGLFGNKELADTISRTVGMKNRGAGALVADTAGLAKPETKTEKVIAEGTKAAAGLLSGSVVNKLAEKSPEAVKGVLNMIMPGTSGSATQVAKDVGIFGGLGASMEAAPAETAAGLALLAGGKAAAGKVMTSRGADKILSKAGSREGGLIDAEVIDDLARVAKNGNLRGNDIYAASRNEVANRYVKDVENAVKQVDPAALKSLDIKSVLAGKKTVTGDDLYGIMGTPSGDALAGAINKYQRLLSLTAQTHASDSLGALAARGVIATAPAAIGGIFGGIPGAVIGAALGPKAERFGQMALGKASIADNTAKVIKKADSAKLLLSREGSSQATQDISRLMEMATKAQQAAGAKATVNAAPTSTADLAKTLGDTATIRQSLGLRGQPLSNAYNTVLTRSGASNEQAIPILRKLAKDFRGNEIGIAADELRRSGNVTNEKAFYSIQDILRDSVKANGGALSQATMAGAKGSSVSSIINKLPDDQVASLLGRSTDTLDKTIKSQKAYLTTRASRAMETYKASPDKLPAEDFNLLKALGLVN